MNFLCSYSTQPQATAALCELLRTRCEAGPPRASQSFRLAVGTCLNWLGRPEQAQADLEEARALAETLGDHGAVANVSHQQARNALLRGDRVAAGAAADAGQRAVHAGGYSASFRLHSWALQALIGVVAGEPGRTWSALRALEAERDGNDLAVDEEVAAARALGWWSLGQPAPAAPG